MVHGKEAHHRTVEYSDSESQTLGKPASKRQKVEKIGMPSRLYVICLIEFLQTMSIWKEYLIIQRETLT